MSITNVKKLSELASTALASYANFSSLSDLGNRLILPDTQQGVGMAIAQKDTFIARYDLKDQHANDLTGFSATLLYDKLDNKKVLALRGTEFGFLNGQILSDFGVADA